MKYDRHAFSNRRNTSGVMIPAVRIGNLLGDVTSNSAFLDIFEAVGIFNGRSSEESEPSNTAFGFFCTRVSDGDGIAVTLVDGTAAEDGDDGTCGRDGGGSAATLVDGTVAEGGVDGTEDNAEDNCEVGGDGSTGGEMTFAGRPTTRPRLACPTSLS